jgi:hypothetical protein
MTKPIRVVFLTFYHEAWDSLEEIYRLMHSDARFEVTVATIPRKLTGDEGYGGEEDTSQFLDSQGVEHIRLNHEDSWVGLAKLRELKPDYVFLNYPWQRNYQPAYRADELVKFTRIAYVPYYSLPLVNEPGEAGVAPHLFEQRSHQLASLVFTQDANLVDAYAATDRGNAHVHLTGSPKIDRLMRLAADGVETWPIPSRRSPSGTPATARPFRIVWAPHHSYSNAWLNFGLFNQTYKVMLRLAHLHPEIDFVLRPHPFLFGTLTDRGVLTADELSDFIEDWNDLPNTCIHTDGEYASLFRATDILVTDGISFLGEYPLVTGRAGVFIENPEHWPFSPLGELAAEANLRIGDPSLLETTLDEIRTVGLPDRSEQIANLRSAASPFPGQAARQIVAAVAADHAAGSELVNPSVVKTTPWERREGREPLVD